MRTDRSIGRHSGGIGVKGTPPDTYPPDTLPLPQKGHGTRHTLPLPVNRQTLVKTLPSLCGR